MAKSFKQDALVWAKMKGYPHWPAKVTIPADDRIPSSKKPQHFVLFFGTHDCAWIADENIEVHSETMLATAKANKKSTKKMLSAIQEIEDASKSASPDAPSSRVENEEAEKELTAESSPPPSKKPKMVTLKKKSINNVMKKVPKSFSKKSHKKRPALNEEEDLDRDLGVNSLSSSSSLEDDMTSLISHSFSNGTKAGGSSTSSPHPREIDLKPTDKKIGFLGLGAMGFRIVQRLLETKHNVTIWNRTRREELDQLTQAGAVFLPTPAEVIRECDITVSCLSGSDAVKCVMYDAGGVLEGFGDACSKAYVELSTIDPMISEEIAETITGKGGKYLEAPMFGQRQDVNKGCMVVMASGDHNLFNECSTLFCAFATSAYYLGTKAGQGNRMSLVLNMWAGVTSAALAETLALIRHIKMPPAFFVDVMDSCPFSSPLLMRMGRAMTSSSDEVSMPVKHQASSLAMAVSLGHTVHQPLSLAVPASAAFLRAAAEDDNVDVSSIFKTML